MARRRSMRLLRRLARAWGSELSAEQPRQPRARDFRVVPQGKNGEQPLPFPGAQAWQRFAAQLDVERAEEAKGE